MIFGKLEIGATALHTHNDSYVLTGISAVSTRRPFLSASLTIGGLLAAFGLSFRDVLYPGEMIAFGSAVVFAVAGGLTVGQLRLISRDLRGSPVAEAVFGTYRHLNRKRRLVAEAVDRVQQGGVS